MARTKKARITILNWMGTLLLCAIPGVNIIALICFITFGKAPSKRTFAWAMLIWMILLIVCYVALIWLLPGPMSLLSDKLRELAAQTAVNTQTLLPTPAP